MAFVTTPIDENKTMTSSAPFVVDPQLWDTYASDIYKHLRALEIGRRPRTDYMENVQEDIKPRIRSILVDWLVEVAEELRLLSETLHLAVNYTDRYLSGNCIHVKQLQLLGVVCLIIASKYEDIYYEEIESFRYTTANAYSKEEALEMESSVLNHLNFEMTAPKAYSFVRQVVCVARGIYEGPDSELDFLASYMAELLLLEYSTLRYAPSLVAASSVFLAEFILHPINQTWSPTLAPCAQFQASDFLECVLALHRLYLHTPDSELFPAMRLKYREEKYGSVAEKFCPSAIPTIFFRSSQDEQIPCSYIEKKQ